MKHHIKIIVILCLLLLFGEAQEWHRLYPFPEVIYNELLRVDFVDKDYGWAVGEWGLIMHTTDFGQNWEIQQNNTLDWDLLSVDFADRLNGWAVGEYGTILKTMDGGIHWTELNVELEMENSNPNYRGVQFITSENGWILPDYGSFILKTSDAGAHWDKIDISADSLINPQFRAFDFIDTMTGWIAGYDNGGLILHTTDGGKTWTRQESNIERTIYDIEFIDSQNGWACGSQTVNTTDGGETWNIVLDDIKRKLSALSSQICWLLDSDGSIIKTEDGGVSWSTLINKQGYYPSDILFIDEKNGWAVGGHSLIMYSSTSGKTWTIQHESAKDNRINGTFMNADTGWMTAGSNSEVLYKTIDGGYTWIPRLSEPDYSYGVPYFIDDRTAWMTIKRDDRFFISQSF